MVECAAEQRKSINGLAQTKGSMYGYSSSAVVKVRDRVPLTSSIDGRELKI